MMWLRKNYRSPWIGALAGLLVAGCADTFSAGVDGGGGSDADAAEPCDKGETFCKGKVWNKCVGGSYVEEDCGDGVCIEGEGCKTCAPETKYCVGNDVFECNADGSSEKKLETCPADQECVLGKCSNLCDMPLKNRSNVGCEFWAVDLPNEYACQSMDGGATCMMHLCAACQQFAVAIANTNTFKARVTVEINEAAPGEPPQLKLIETKEIPHGSLALINLPMREVDCTEWYKDSTGKMRRKDDSKSCLSSRAFRIKSTVPVIAYQFNPIINDSSNGASLLIPKNGLDTEYRVLGWSTSNPVGMDMPGMVMEGIPDAMNVTVVGIEENTQVEVVVAHNIVASPDGKIPAANKGEKVTVTLGPFDVLNLNSRQSFDTPGNISGDMTGTLVKASAPVVVFSGGARSSVPGMSLDEYSPRPPEPSDPEYDTCCTEHFEQQMFPVSSLGTKFAITRTPVRSVSVPEPDLYRILSIDDKTIVTTNLTEFPTFHLPNASDQANFWATGPFTVTSDKPIMIAQYAVAQGFLEAGSTGDPEFVVFPPVEQYRPQYLFLTPPTFDHDYVVIGAPEAALIKVDNDEISGEFNTKCHQTDIGTIDAQTYVEYRCSVADGVHRVESSMPIGITVYGYYNVGSYGYPGGADVKQINIR